MRERNRRLTEEKAGHQPAMEEEADGSRWVDFEVGGRSEATFLRLYGRLPEAERYYSDAYRCTSPGCLWAGTRWARAGW